MVFISNQCIDAITAISRDSVNPGGSYNSMRRTIQSSIRLLKAESVVELISNLIYRNVPLRQVKNSCESVCDGLPYSKVRELISKVMHWKLCDAKTKLCEIKRDNTREWRPHQRALIRYNVYNKFYDEWEKEKHHQRTILREKRTKKIQFLQTKHRLYKQKRTPECATIKNIIIRDQPNPTSYD